MPVYDFRCEVCGETLTDVFQKMSAEPPECGMCLMPMKKKPSAPAVVGGDWLDHGLQGRYSKQAGRHFKNSKELDAWAASRGLAPVSSTSREWRAIRDSNKEEAQVDAKKQGFTDQEDRKRRLKDNSRDHLAAAGQKKIDAYHDEHGTEGKKAVEEFVKLPEKKPTVSVAG